ncbi:hypothetical protein C8R47DRAFT_1199649 [Mycena vitilis]|nr:hypothetical protein C8R47DRAFT_1199649 [Mycena vitilis]
MATTPTGKVRLRAMFEKLIDKSEGVNGCSLPYSTRRQARLRGYIVRGHIALFLLPPSSACLYSCSMNSSAWAIDMIVVAAGETRLAAYVEQTFPEVAGLGYYTAENAVDWLDLDAFTRFLAQPLAQKNSQSTTLQNATPICAVRPSEQSRQSCEPTRGRVRTRRDENYK